MDLHKFGFKFFATDAERLDILELIPVYHRWIQQNALDELLIDVADYSHVPAGPGVMLIAFNGNYALDETDRERGVLYYSKLPLAGGLAERLAQVASRALKAAELLRGELAGALQIPGNRLQFFANDRLAAPNTDAAYAELEPALRTVLDRLYDGAHYSLVRDTDPRQRLSVRVQADSDAPLATLLTRLS